MTDSTKLRLDPCHSKAFSWIEYDPDAPEVRHPETNRLVRPAGPTLTVHYRTNGAEWEAWPVTEEEARAIMQPGQIHDFSSGRAYSQLIQPYKSKRLLKPGERQETVKQRTEQEKRAGRMWI